MTNVSQENVLNWLSNHLSSTSVKCTIPSGVDNRGPDMVIEYSNGFIYHVESISFTYSNRGKKQSDFWKAFAQAISRLNPASQWGHPNKVVIALPYEFRNGWAARTRVHGKEVWDRIGNAFHELEIWFVSEDKLEPYSWNDAYLDHERSYDYNDNASKATNNTYIPKAVTKVDVQGDYKYFDLTGWQLVIANILYDANRGMKNKDILEDGMVREKGDGLKRLSGIISKTLNAHSEKGISNDAQRREPEIFGKDGQGRWILNAYGRWLVE